MFFRYIITLATVLFVVTVSAQTPTPHLMTPYTIPALRERIYPGGEILIRNIEAQSDAFTRYAIEYPSDGLTITGIMYVPVGEGPFPVVILNHGYWSRETYTSGTDTWQAAEYLAARGYLTIAPDFRSWGGSDTGISFFHTGLVIDVLNLISSLPSLEIADTERIGMWGHSMGGGMTTKILTIDSRVRAAVLYAPNSADDADLIATYGPGCDPTQPYRISTLCNEAEIVPPSLPEEIFLAYADAVYNPDMLFQTSPINYLHFVTAPVQIHIGTLDEVTIPAWSEKIYAGLLAEGKDVELFYYEGQGHFFQGQHWITFMERATAFFDAHLIP